MASTINASTTLGLISSADTSGVLQLQTANTIAVTIDASQNVGVGTSSPTNKLDVAGTARTSNTTGNKVFNLGQSTPSGNDGASLEFQNSNAQTNWAIRTNWNIGGALEFCPSSAAGGTSYTTPSMAINSSGNLGLGVTPSAWSEGRAIERRFAGTADWGYLQAESYRTTNAYFNGGWKYGGTGAACKYGHVNGTHEWSTAPSGTAGNAITFTQAMTLDANGLLQVGATSPINSGAVTFASTGGTYNQLELCDTRAYSSTPNSSLGFAVKYNSAGSYTNMAAIVGTKENATDGNYSGALLFYTSLNGSGSAERARILSSGEFLVSTTTSFGVGVTIFTPDSGGSYSNATSTAARNHWRFANANGAVGSIQTSGSLTLYNTTSDYRLKTVIGAVTGHGERIDALEPIEYEWKSDGARTRGFLAHKFQEMYPQSVSGEKDAVDADGNPVYQNMQASTSEVIADLVAEIQSLRQRLAVLEGK